MTKRFERQTKFSGDVITDGDLHFEPEGDSGVIEVSGGIKCKSLFIKAGEFIEAGGSIKAGEFIEAGGSIKAGEFIKAGWSIEFKSLREGG